MRRIASSLRLTLLKTFSGNDDGSPPWAPGIIEGEDAGYFGAESAAWVVHGGMPTLVAGIRALLLQTLHPGAMAGVHDWSRYREDPLGRLSGTIQWLVTVTFADTVGAQRESARVGRFHGRVAGTYLDVDGLEREYFAGDPELLSWVHVVFTDSFLRCHETWGAPIPGGSDQYVREWATAGELVGVQHPPRSEAELREQFRGFDPHLKVDQRVADAVRFIRNPPLSRRIMPAYRVLFAGAVATIPDEYCRMLGLRRPGRIAVWATGRVLALVGMLLGTSSPAERAARARVARLEPALGHDATEQS